MGSQGNSLVNNTRRPYGSVECRPQGVIEKDFVLNGCFDDFNSTTDIPGYFIPTQNLNTTRVFDRVKNIEHPSCEYALTKST